MSEVQDPGDWDWDGDGLGDESGRPVAEAGPAAPAAEDPGKKKVAAESGGIEAAGEFPLVPPRVNTEKRAMALVIDFGAVWIAGVVASVLATLVLSFANSYVLYGVVTGLVNAACAYYMLYRDSEVFGRSLGKRVMGLRVVGPDGAPCSREASAWRNLTLAGPWILGAFQGLLLAIPGVGFLLSIFLSPLSLAAYLAIGYEVLQVAVLDPGGRRMLERRAEAYTIPA